MHIESHSWITRWKSVVDDAGNRNVVYIHRDSVADCGRLNHIAINDADVASKQKSKIAKRPIPTDDLAI